MVKFLKLSLSGVNILTLSLLFIFASSSIASSLTPTQRAIYRSGNGYFDEEPTVFCESPITASVSLEAGSSVYLLGDSIIAGNQSVVEAAFEDSSLVLSGINANGGRAISKDTAGSDSSVLSSGLDAVADDSEVISNADAVVVELGTNSHGEDLNVQIPALLSAVKETGFNGILFWVNTFHESTNTRKESTNAVISDFSTNSIYPYTVIDANSFDVELLEDNVHPTLVGAETFAQSLVNSLESASATTQSSGAGGGILGLTFPALQNEQQVGVNLTEKIRSDAPNSPFFEISENIGTLIIEESKSRDINPLYIAAVAKQENGWGTIGPAARVNNNAFGWTTSSGYRSFSSMEEGFYAFLDKTQENVHGPDRGFYEDVNNIYEHFAKHQSGTIAYPGEPLDPNDVTGPQYVNGRLVFGDDARPVPDGNTELGYDPRMGVYISWDPVEQPNPNYSGQIYNPLIYYENAIALINEITGLNLSNVPSRGGGGGSVCGGSNLSTSDYVFPLAPQTKSGVGGAVPCDQNNSLAPAFDLYEPGPVCHHDGTPAFDLFGPDSADVYAITNGTIDGLNPSHKNIPGCTMLQIHGDDGFYYFYGHLKNPVVTDGARVNAGQKVAEVADSDNFTSACWGGGPHLHIDRGCVTDEGPQRGGNDPCRDMDFIELMNNLYEELPE